MNNDRAERQPFRFTGKHMVFAMVAFFGVIIAVNITMATLASSSWTGLVVKNSYVASQKYNAQLADSQAQAERGWRSNVSYRDGLLTVDVSDRTGTRLRFDRLDVSIGRPAFEQEDRMLALQPVGAVWQSKPLGLEAGTWMLRVEATGEEIGYRRDLRLHVIDGKGKVE